MSEDNLDDNPKSSHVNVVTSYETLGDYQTAIPEYVRETLRQKEEERMGSNQENSFYLNSSDSLTTLMALDLQGKKVLTVSGSGEFSHVFINDGAAEVCNFDISPAAAFNAELRHTALSILDMDDYMKLFGGWLTADETEEDQTLLDAEIYQKIEADLSKEAQIYFKTLFQTPGLINYEKSWNGFARSRYNRETKHNRLIGDIIKDESQYKALQAKAREATFRQVITDVADMETLVETFKPDMLYISNIGYQPERTIGIAKTYIDQGVPEVICTISPNDSEFTDSRGLHDYDSNNLYYDGQVLKVGSTFMYELWDKENHEYVQVKAEVIGINRAIDYGLALKISKST